MSLSYEEMHTWWDGAAHANVMTAILSSNQKWNKREFFQTGHAWFNECLKFAEQSGIELGGDAALDFGCGIGRMAAPLAARYRKVIGMDISDEMIRLARRYVGRSAEFICSAQPPFPLPDGSVDLVFSIIVVQHISQPHNFETVEEMFRVSRDLVMFDAPSRKLRPDDPEPGGGIFLLDEGNLLSTAARSGFRCAAKRLFPVTLTQHYQYIFKRE